MKRSADSSRICRIRLAAVLLLVCCWLLAPLTAAQGGGWGGNGGNGGSAPKPEKTVEYPPAGAPPEGLWQAQHPPTSGPTEVAAGTLLVKIVARGTLSPLIETRIPAKTWGVITEMAPEGAKVEKGDVLFKLDITDVCNQFQIHLGYLIREVGNHLKDVETNGKRQRSLEMDLELAGWNAEEARLRELDMEAGASADTWLNARLRMLTAQKALILAQQQETSKLDLGARGFASANEVRLAKQKRIEAEVEVTRSELNMQKVEQGVDPEQYAQAELNCRSARDRVRELIENLAGVYTQLRMDENQFRRTLADRYGNLRDDKKKIEDSLVTSPHRGRAHILTRWGQAITPGRDVWSGIPVYSLPDPSKLKVVLKIDERHISQVKVGQPAWMKIPAFPGEIFGGRVIKIADSGKDEFSDFRQETIEKTGSADRQTFEVTVALDGEDSRLAQGLTAQVRILSDHRQKVLWIPADVVFKEGNRTLVELAGGGGRVEVVTGSQSDGLIEIVSGLKVGDRVQVPTHLIQPMPLPSASTPPGGGVSGAAGVGPAAAPRGGTAP